MIINKQKVAHILRHSHLLKFAGNLLFLSNVVKNRKSNKLFLNEHPDFIPPPAYLAFDAYNHTSNKAYHDTGLIHSNLISDLIKEHVTEREIKICEWGCGPARVIRHLEEITGFTKIKLYGTDYNKKSISWCKNNLKNVSFSLNSLEPPLPFESETFDCVYAISIFTHLSEIMHYAWIEELFRILKPNGILIFTTQGDNFIEKLLPLEKEKYDSGELVIRDKVEEGKKEYSAFHSPGFIKNKLLKDYLIVKHISNPAQYQLAQEVWVAKKHS